MKQKLINVYSRVAFPQMRQILLMGVDDLSDKELQFSSWGPDTDPRKFWWYAEPHLETILEDFELGENPEDKLGYILVDQAECNVLQPLAHLIDDVYEKIGPEKTNDAYLQSPVWKKMRRQAKRALRVMMNNEEKAKKIDPSYWKGEDEWGV